MSTEEKNCPQLKFDINLGVRQGGPESPILFNLFLDYVLRIFLLMCDESRIKFHETPNRILDAARHDKRNKNYNGTLVNVGSAYADDLVLFFDDHVNLQNGLDTLNNTCMKYGLTINGSKTKSMILNADENLTYPHTICDIAEITIENVTTFKHLGTVIHYKRVDVGRSVFRGRGHWAMPSPPPFDFSF